MKKIRGLTLVLLASPVFASMDVREIHLFLSITDGEHSRDSNSTTTKITINGNRLVFDRSYSGYGASRRKPVHKEIDIKDEEITKLKALIASRSFLDSASLVLPTDGPGRYSIIVLNVLADKKKFPITISGMAKQLEGEKLYQNVQALRDEIEAIVGGSQ